MSLLDVLQGAVAIADNVTKDLQPIVDYHRFVSADYRGESVYDPPLGGLGVGLHAIVDWKQKQVRTPTGELTVTRASITLLNIDEVVAATGGDGIGDQDVFILPDGTTGPILDMGGFIDASTGHPIATEVFLG
jgi:hypothetical protein